MGCGAVVGLSSILNLNNTNLSSNKLNNSSSSSNWSAVGGDGSSDEPNHLSKLTVPGYKWRLVISYDGTRFSGWQYQQSPPTIQCIVEKALTRITKLDRKDLHLVGASRTDKGVHAMGQVAHFITPFNYDRLESIHAALNGLLPPDIRVREISPAAPEFHARFSAKGKIYHYKIFNDTIMDPFHRQYAYHSVYKLNTVVMREAAKNFIGKHDFSAFVNASHNDRLPDPAKSIFRFDVIEMGPLLQLEVEGSGFLYRQVRNMVALLLQIGREAIPPDIVSKILVTRDRKELAKFALSAPPHGLCLIAVQYNEKHLLLPTGCPPTSLGYLHFYQDVCTLFCLTQYFYSIPYFRNRKNVEVLLIPLLKNLALFSECLKNVINFGNTNATSELPPRPHQCPWLLAATSEIEVSEKFIGSLEYRRPSMSGL